MSSYKLEDYIPKKYHFILIDGWKTSDVDLSLKINMEMAIDALSNQFLFAAAFLSIRNKFQEIVPLRANEAQIKYQLIRRGIKRKQKDDPTVLMRIIILKARQQGISTWEAALNFTASIRNANTEAAHISHDSDTTANFLNMDNRFHEHLPEPMKSTDFLYSMGRHLMFKDNSSMIKCMTAGNSKTGVGTTTQRLHASEVALWDHGDSLMSGLLPAIPKNITSVVVAESTAREMSGWYYDTWVGAYDNKDTEAWNGWFPVFLSWHTFAEYTIKLTEKQALKIRSKLDKKEMEFIEIHGKEFEIEHEIYERLAWRRMTKRSDCKNSDIIFDREYPDRPEVAFMAAGGTYFDASEINKKHKLAEKINQANKIISGSVLKLRPPITYSAESERINAINKGLFFKDKDKIFNFRKDERGYFSVLHFPQTTHINRYVISADPAKGINADEINKTDPDWSVAYVHDRLKNIDVAQYRSRVEEHEFAKALNAIGWFYMNNDCTPAKIIVESNINATLLFLIKVHDYPNLFFREEADSSDLSYKPISKYGFETNKVTRPIALAKLQEKIKLSTINNPFVEFWDECKAFIVTVKGRPEARKGRHDDCVLSRAILEIGLDSMALELVLPFKRNPLHLGNNSGYKVVDEKSNNQPWAI